MRHPALKSLPQTDVFTDLLFNALLGFVFMFLVAFLMISNPDKQGDIVSNAEMLITVRWPDNHPDDVDAIIEDPNGVLIWYYNSDSGLIHLDRDDRGLYADQVEQSGTRFVNPINQETLTLRGLAPGEYVVNLLHYKAHYREALPVTVKVEKLNPKVSLVYYGEHSLTGTGHEVTALRFTLDDEGVVNNVSQLQKPLLTSNRATVK
ncbi:MAG: hypothetical protein ISP92_01485 [Pseudomonadales bacterium]|nr:hypothetical protein [Pseudomonadales bacterium]